MIEKNKFMYNEIYDFLNILGSDYISKIPRKLYEFIEKERVTGYTLELKMEQKISEQISEEALAFILYLNLMYWSSPQEKEKLINIYKENDKKEEERLRRLYDIDIIFKKNKEEGIIQSKTEEIAMVEYKEHFIKKILNKIYSFFYRK